MSGGAERGARRCEGGEALRAPTLLTPLPRSPGICAELRPLQLSRTALRLRRPSGSRVKRPLSRRLHLQLKQMEEE
ncbi:uncharacterized protein A4U43_C10F2580 [Asparagus officinalis]|uniref:Uncharacterized protein n=1 Tax=Asparagus officinalis TaxID=4686 RepID=A0A5P1E364_ASPOF|nr:uncharacterized protein A4U43_C10F2580 [Asparagus officinalis]